MNLPKYRHRPLSTDNCCCCCFSGEVTGNFIEGLLFVLILHFHEEREDVPSWPPVKTVPANPSICRELIPTGPTQIQW